jgi:excisionase family DNA binding protein
VLGGRGQRSRGVEAGVTVGVDGISRTNPADQLLSPDEAGQLLGLSAYTVRQFARDRRIPAIRLGRFWRFRRSSLEHWIAEQERAPR